MTRHLQSDILQLERKTSPGFSEERLNAPKTIEYPELWEQLRANPKDIETRNKLFLAYVDWARRVVRKVVRSGSMWLETPDELFSSGCLGLITAIEKFDPDRGVSFKGFSYWQIVGSVQSHAGRVTTDDERYCRLLRDRTRLNHIAGYRLNDHELSERLGMTEAKLTGIVSAGSRYKSRSIDAMPVSSLGRSKCPAPDHQAEMRDSAKAVLNLASKNYRKEVWLHFGEETNLQEAGNLLGCSRQNLHAKAVRGHAEILDRLTEEHIALFGIRIPASVIGGAA